MLLYILGGLLVAAAAVFLITRKKDSGKKKPPQFKGPWGAGYRVQLPVDSKGKRGGKMTSVTPDKSVAPWFRVGNPLKFRIEGKPCATSPNSTSCRSEMKQQSYHKSGEIQGWIKVREAEEDTSVIQLCGENIRCPSFMFRYDSDGYFRWHTNGKTKDGREKIDSGRVSHKTALGKKVPFRMTFGKDGVLKGEVDGFKFTAKFDDREKHHFKFGVYGSGVAEAWFYDVKIRN